MLTKIEYKEVKKIKHDIYSYKTVLVAEADYLEEDEKILIECMHKSIWDLKPYLNPHIITKEGVPTKDDWIMLDTPEEEQVKEFIEKKINFFKKQNLDNGKTDAITVYTNRKVSENCIYKDIEFVKDIKDIKKMDIVMAIKHTFEDCVRGECIDIYEYCDTHIKRHEMTKEYIYNQWYSSGGLSKSYKISRKKDLEMYEKIEEYLKNKNILFSTQPTTKDFKLLKEKEKIFNSLALKFPIELDKLEESINAKKNFGKKVVETANKNFGKKRTKEMLKSINISTLDYINTLEENKNYIPLSDVRYAFKYGSWKHLFNVLGEDFPCMRTFPSTEEGVMTWLKIREVI